MTDAEAIEVQACEHCQKEYPIEQVHTMEGCWICDGCYAEWKAEFDACDHDWAPDHDEFGEPGKACRKCSGFVAD